MRVRLWLIGAVCIACGVASQVAFALYAEPSGRVETVWASCFAFVWYASGLLLWLTHLTSPRSTPGSGKKRLAGWIAWAAAVVAALLAVVWSMPP